MINRLTFFSITLGLAFHLLSALAFCGPFAPIADKTGSTAVSMNDEKLIAWATGWTDLTYGDRVTSTFKTPDNALGQATGNTYDIVSLGAGGSITLTFAEPIRNNTGWDFTVFENGFNDSFLELAFVEVSSNGSDFIRFDNWSLTETAVSEFGTIDTTNIHGLAGKYRIGYGTPFDLSDLALNNSVINGTVDLSTITHVRIIDISGDGSLDDSGSNPIYDPYPTNNSAGFDLEAVGVRYQNTGSSNTAPEAPSPETPLDNEVDVSLAPTLTLNSISDSDSEDIHLLTRWQVATEATFQAANTVLDIYSHRHLESLFIPEGILANNTSYHWRTQAIDGPGTASGWSSVYSFSTAAAPGSTTISYRDWDNDGVTDNDIPSFTSVNSDGDTIQVGIHPESNIQAITSHRAFLLDDFQPLNNSDSPDSFPAGLFGFKVTPTNSSAFTTITVYLSESMPETAYWYTYDTRLGWQLSPHADFNTDRNRITIRLMDGTTRAGDNDGSDNSSIIFAGGPGIKQAGNDTTSPTGSNEEGIGDKGGCFVTTVTPQQASQQTIALFAMLLSGAVFSLVSRLTANQASSTKTRRKLPRE